MLHQLRTARAILAADLTDTALTALVVVVVMAVSPFLVLIMEAFRG